jgi:plastocyanin
MLAKNPLLFLGAAAFLVAGAVIAAGAYSRGPADAGVTPDAHVLVTDDAYCDPDGLQCAPALPVHTTNIEEGEVVMWEWMNLVQAAGNGPGTDNLHSVTECTDATFTDCGADVDPDNPIGDSGLRDAGTHTTTFENPGIFYYRCDAHPNDMRGQVVVAGVPTPTPTPEIPTPTPTLPIDTPTPTPTLVDTPTPTLPIDTPTPPLTPTPTPTPIPATPTPTPGPVFLRGDANCDGVVDSTDALIILLHRANLPYTLPAGCPPLEHPMQPVN